MGFWEKLNIKKQQAAREKRKKEEADLAEKTKQVGQTIYSDSLDKLVVERRLMHGSWTISVWPQSAAENSAPILWYRLPTFADMQIFISNKYRYLTAFFDHVLHPEKLGADVKTDIDDLWKVLLYSDSDVYNHDENMHECYLNYQSPRTFSDQNLAGLRMCVNDSGALETDINNLVRRIPGSDLGKTAHKEQLREIKKREMTLSQFVDLPMFSWLKIFFVDSRTINQEDADQLSLHDIALKIMKYVNYLQYKDLRSREGNDTLLVQKRFDLFKTEGVLQSYSDKIRGINLTTNPDMVSCDICSFYLWQSYLVNYLCVLFCDVDFLGEGNMGDLLLNPNRYRKLILQRINDNRAVKMDPDFDAAELASDYTRYAMEMGFNVNSYWHMYHYFKIQDTGGDTVILDVLGKPTTFTRFQFTCWLMSICALAVKKEYIVHFIIYKLCEVHLKEEIMRVIRLYMLPPAVSGDCLGITGKYKKLNANTFYLTYVVPFLRMLYSTSMQLAVPNVMAYYAQWKEVVADNEI